MSARSPRTNARRAMAAGLLCLLAACGKSSRFDDQAAVDVCALVETADAERILGELTQPAAGGTGNGAAGGCTWRFVSASGDRGAMLTAVMETAASDARTHSLGHWFDMHVPALKAQLDAHPRELKHVGDRAYLFGSSASVSAILLRQSRTFVMLRMYGGTSAQLEDFAGILVQSFDARHRAPVTKAVAANPQPRGMDVAAAAATETAATATESAGRPTRGPPASEREAATASPPPAPVRDSAKRDQEKTLLAYTLTFVEQCTRADSLLRTTCDRWGTQLRADLRHNCELPAETFASRTADSYRAFKARFSAQIAANEPFLSTTLAEQRADFDRQFAQEIAGNMVGMELERLHGMLGRECVAIEGEWLPQLR